ncbi:MAG: hypothetical protein R3A79_30605 [Nannocystaceae bacterium]
MRGAGATPGADREAEAHAAALRERGFTVVDGGHTPEQVARLRAALAEVYARSGAPAPYDPKGRAVAADVQLAPTGFVLTRLLALCPELADDVLAPRVVAAARALLGPYARLELTGAVICDERRPFFSWHNHIGGIDVEDYRERREYPRFAASQRVIVVHYLDAIDADGGELRVLPRALAEATEPPHDIMREDWPGHERVHLAAGSTLILEQCTWHAVMPVRRPGLRMFVGAYLTSPEAPATAAVDDSLRAFTGGGPLLRSLLPR